MAPTHKPSLPSPSSVPGIPAGPSGPQCASVHPEHGVRCFLKPHDDRTEHAAREHLPEFVYWREVAATSAAPSWCARCSESYPDATAAEAHAAATGHVLTEGPSQRRNGLSDDAGKVFELVRTEGPRVLRGDRDRLAALLGMDVPALSAAVKELHRAGHLFFDATYLLTFSEAPGVPPTVHPGALAQMLEDSREELEAALSTLPTRAPTAAEVAEDPTALDDCLSTTAESLAVLGLHLAAALALVRASARGTDAAPSLAECAHEPTPSAPYTCSRCGAALERNRYEPKVGPEGVRHV